MTVLQSPSTRARGRQWIQHTACGRFGLSESRIRDYVRHNLLTPQRTSHGHFRFSFQDVVFFAQRATDAAISVRQNNRALTKLKADLITRLLSAVRIYANGSVEVQDDEKAWEVESGQLTMNFSIQSLQQTLLNLLNQPPVGKRKHSRI